ncbi:MAG: glycosyltransferase [Bacteroidetes bacterium]|jgi:glycosyltransferase involved in cell wall biosynthesis|nr:glycosyltransferase [Bacteroidota bacterium]
MPRASIIIPVYNEEDHIEGLCKSLQAQTLSDLEILIIDNESTDRTAEIASKYFPIHRCEERGSYAARNYGLELAKGDYYLFTDGDCILEPDWAQQLVASLDEGQDAVAGRTEVILERDGLLLKYLSHYLTIVLVTTSTGDNKECIFPTCNVGYKKELFERLGPFQVRTGGDVFFSNAVLASGYKCKINSKALVHHILSQGYRDVLIRYFRYGDAWHINILGIIPAIFLLLLTPVIFLIIILNTLTFERVDPMTTDEKPRFLESVLKQLAEIIKYGTVAAGTIWYSIVGHRDRIF